MTEKTTVEIDSRETPVLTNEKLAKRTTDFVFGERYLRNRPFLVVTAIQRPKRGVRTERAGWTKEPQNWDLFERPTIVDRVSDKMMSEATVIVDLLNSKLVKNRFTSTDATEEQVLGHYLGKYSSEVTEGIQIWTNQVAGAVVKDSANG